MTHRQSPLSKLAAASAYPSAAAKLLRRLIPMGSRPRVKVSSELSGTGFENDLPDIESFGRYLPYDEVIDNHFVALSAADPAGPEGLGFTIEVTPQTGVTPEMEKTLLTLIQTPLAVGSTIAVTVSLKFGSIPTKPVSASSQNPPQPSLAAPFSAVRLSLNALPANKFCRLRP